MASLILASLAALVLLYVPGFMFFRALRFSDITALVAAPIASAGAYGLLPVIYGIVGISCDVFNVVIVPTILFAIGFIVTLRFSRGSRKEALRYPDDPGTWRQPGAMRDFVSDWGILGLYVLCGVIVCTITFIANMGSPEAFFSRYDNQTHLNLTQSFVDSGLWSAIDHSRYAAADPSQIPYNASKSGFYPDTWHIIVALLCLITGAKVTVASNALLAVVAAVVFPAGMFLLIRTLFPGERTVVLAGALTAVAFATYPWVFPIKGPTMPNMLGFAFMVPALAVLISYLERGLIRSNLVQFILFAGATFISLAIAHTNALFTAFVFLAAYGGHYIDAHVRKSPRIPDEKRSTYRIAAIAAYIALIIAFWAFCLTTPILRSVVGYNHVEHNSVLVAIDGLCMLRLTINTPQYAMVFVSLIGVISCIKRRMWWILIPVVYMAIGYFVSRTGFKPLLTIFMGLWYSLPYRAGACLCIFLMPVAALGLSDICRFVCAFVRDRADKFKKLSAYPQIAGALVVALISIVTFAPVSITIAGHTGQTPFNSIYHQLGTTVYGQDANRVYGAEEVAFVDKVVNTIPEGALVLSNPHDGSLFAYGVNHLNSYYRATSIKNQKPESNILRKHIDEYAVNPEVQAAVKATGLQYVLQLDQGVKYDDLIKLPQFYSEKRWKWSGIDRMRDDTPGFSLVLSEGDMRLFKVEDLNSL